MYIRLQVDEITDILIGRLDGREDPNSIAIYLYQAEWELDIRFKSARELASLTGAIIEHIVDDQESQKDYFDAITASEDSKSIYRFCVSLFEHLSSNSSYGFLEEEEIPF